MPVEPRIIDANVLVYAFDADAPQHPAARALLEAARDGYTTLYVTSQILCEFYRSSPMCDGFQNRALLPTH